MRITIRRVNSSDPHVLQTLKDLHGATFPGTPEPEYGEGWWWLVYSGSTPVGFAGMGPSARWERTGYFNRAGVTYLFQGKGIQKRLIKTRMAWARKIGYTHVVSDTRENPASANSLIKCGFKIYEPKYPWAFKESLYWIRKL